MAIPLDKEACHYAERIRARIPRVLHPEGDYTWRVHITYGAISQWQLVVNRWSEKFGVTIFGTRRRIYTPDEFSD